MNKQQLQQEIAELQKQLEEKQKALSAMPDKWEPNKGIWFVNSIGEVVESRCDLSNNFGCVYATREQAEKAAKAMRAHNRLLAYVAEFATDYEYEYLEQAWFVSVDNEIREWFADWCTDFAVGMVYMPEHIAKELAAKLNSGEVEL